MGISRKMYEGKSRQKKLAIFDDVREKGKKILYVLKKLDEVGKCIETWSSKSNNIRDWFSKHEGSKSNF